MMDDTRARVMNMIARGVLSRTDDASDSGMQLCEVSLLHGEAKATVERFQQYGFTSVAPNESEAVVFFIGGGRDHGIILSLDNRVSRMPGQAEGEVSLYTDEGDFIALKRNQAIELRTKRWQQRAETETLLESPEITLRGDIAHEGKTDQLGDYNLAGTLTVDRINAGSIGGAGGTGTPGGVLPDAPVTGKVYGRGGDPTLRAGADWREVLPAAALPVGAMLDYAGSGDPPYWLFCDGRAVPRFTYAALFAAIGTTWGMGDGVTTFNIPDWRGRVAVGHDPGEATGRVNFSITGINVGVIGASGGSQYLQQHAHTITDSGHNHYVNDPQHSHTGGNHQHVQENHQHGLYDPGHGHGISDPGHGHTLDVGIGYYVGMGGGGNGFVLPGGSALGAHGSGTGIGIYGSGTNALADWGGVVWTQAGTGGVQTTGSGTGIWLNASNANISINNTGSGGAQNMPPVLVAPKIIFTGV